MEFKTKKSLNYEIEELLKFKDSEDKVFFEYDLKLMYEEMYEITKIAGEGAKLADDPEAIAKAYEIYGKLSKKIFKKSHKEASKKLGAERDLYIIEIVGMISEKSMSKQNIATAQISTTHPAMKR